MDPARVLVADDEPRLLHFVTTALTLGGYEALSAADGETALSLVREHGPDLLVLDILMPGLDGFEVIRRVRSFSEVPIVVLTARDQEEDKVKGLELGADDYLTKPFGTRELLARIRAVLRRVQPPEKARVKPRLTLGDITVDFNLHLVEIKGEEVHLTPTEFRLLGALVQSLGRVITGAELLDRVWGSEYRDEDEILRTNVYRLRRKLGDVSAEPRFIHTRPGVGYIFQPTSA